MRDSPHQESSLQESMADFLLTLLFHLLAVASPLH